MKKANTTTINTKAINKILASETSKSAKIKALFDGGLEVKAIAQLLEIRYNFAYNVISNYCNIEDIDVEATKTTSKKDQVIALFQQGLSNKEIAKELKTNYNYVCKILKENATQA